MCNPISFCMKPSQPTAAQSTPPIFYLHKIKPLINHSHTAIAQSHGLVGNEHDSLIKWEYRPYKMIGSRCIWLGEADIKPDIPFQLINDSFEKSVSNSDFDAALAFAKTLPPIILKKHARRLHALRRVKAVEARKETIRKARALSNRAYENTFAAKAPRSNKINVTLTLDDYNLGEWWRTFKRGRHTILQEEVWKNGAWVVRLNTDKSELSPTQLRALQTFLCATTHLSLQSLGNLKFTLSIFASSITVPNRDLWFEQLVRLMGYKKPIPGGTGF